MWNKTAEPGKKETINTDCKKIFPNDENFIHLCFQRTSSISRSAPNPLLILSKPRMITEVWCIMEEELFPKTDYQQSFLDNPTYVAQKLCLIYNIQWN